MFKDANAFSGFSVDDLERPNIAWFKDPAGNILSVLEEPA
jgi:hypothetical protein